MKGNFYKEQGYKETGYKRRGIIKKAKDVINTDQWSIVGRNVREKS